MSSLEAGLLHEKYQPGDSCFVNVGCRNWPATILEGPTPTKGGCDEYVVLLSNGETCMVDESQFCEVALEKMNL